MMFVTSDIAHIRLRTIRGPITLFFLGLSMAACTAVEAPAVGTLATQRFAAYADLPAIVAQTQTDVAQAEISARRIDARLPGATAGARIVEASAAPFLYGSPVGRRFLAASGARALARGDPAAQCPAAGLAVGPPTSDPGTVSGAALSGCLALLSQQGRGATCGCRILAIDNALAVSLRDLSYAPGVSARLFGITGARQLIAEERTAPDGESTRVAFYDARGPVAIAELHPDGSAQMLDLGGGAVFAGFRELHGWRRGRVAERLLLTGEDGKRVIALIGFEPADIAAAGNSLAAWPATARDKG